MEWNVIRHNINKDEIEIFNIFKHGGFKDDVLTYFKNCENKDDFANKVNSSLRYYFWSRCEWEVIISPWVGKRDNTKTKIDVYWQVKNNWNIFIDYIWEQLSKKNSITFSIDEHIKRKVSYEDCINFIENALKINLLGYQKKIIKCFCEGKEVRVTRAAGRSMCANAFGKYIAHLYDKNNFDIEPDVLIPYQAVLKEGALNDQNIEIARECLTPDDFKKEYCSD